MATSSTSLAARPTFAAARAICSRTRSRFSETEFIVEASTVGGRLLFVYFGAWHKHRYNDSVYCAGVVRFNLRRRNSIAQSAAMVRTSLVTCVARTLP